MVKVKDFMIPEKDIVKLPINASLETVASTMLAKAVGSVLIVDQNEQEIGLITKSDVLDAYCTGIAPETEVSRSMSRMVFYCQEDDTRETASQMMKEKQIHHILVRNAELKLTGLVASMDIVASLAQESQETFPFLKSLFNISKERVHSGIQKLRGRRYGEAVANLEKGMKELKVRVDPMDEPTAKAAIKQMQIQPTVQHLTGADATKETIQQ